MLVLTRFLDEQIVINDNIVITITSIKNINGKTQIKLGFTAPQSVKIHRKEVYDAIKNQEKIAMAHNSIRPNSDSIQHNGSAGV